MNQVLESLAASINLAAPGHERLGMAFSHACVGRVQHLLDENAVQDCLAVLGRFLEGSAGRAELDQATQDAARLANGHRGSKSIDGCGHAAVSATYAVARALAGKPIDAASYAAYAAVYAQGGYAAVAERESFEPEHAWQVAALEALARSQPMREAETRALPASA